MFAREAAIEVLPEAVLFEVAVAQITTAQLAAALVSEAGIRVVPVPAVRQETVAMIAGIMNPRALS